MKIRLMLLMIFGYTIAFSQTQTETELPLPNVNIPSPGAFQLTQYGDNPINEFNGRVSTAIPLYTYKLGNLELPISLTYDAAGVKVDDLPTWTGINWTLQAGGVISRIVKDMPDENAPTRIHLSDAEIERTTLSDCSPDTAQYFEYGVAPSQQDKEVDLFSFSFPGYSGTFYIDFNGKAQLTKMESELKIDISNFFGVRNNQIIITTPNGVKYYFGGASDAIEISAGYSGSKQNGVFSATSFYLSKIEHPVNGVINFEYEVTTGNQIYSINKSSFVGHALAIPSTGELPLVQQVCSLQSKIFVTHVYQSKFLSKITGEDSLEEVIFNTTEYTNANFIKVLNSIEVKNRNVLTRKIDLSYLLKDGDFTRADRFFLEKVEIDKDFDIGNPNGKKFEEYKMVYDEPLELPKRLSFEQDILGFYNNEVQNISLIPNDPLGPDFVTVSNYGFANRHAKFEFATKGAMKQLYYPTGGFTEFDYEPAQPVIKKTYSTYEREVYINSSTDKLLHSELPGLDENGEIIFDAPIYVGEGVDITINMGASDMSSYEANHIVSTLFKITDLENGTVVFSDFARMGYNPTSRIVRFPFVTGKRYKVEITMDESAYSGSGSVFANFNFTLWTGVDTSTGMGIRIKRQTDYTNVDKKAKTMRYYYCPIENIARPYDLELVPDILQPNFKSQVIGDFPFLILYSDVTNKYCNFNASNNGNIVFKNVTISYGGDDFEQGGMHKIFSYQSNFRVKRCLTEYGALPKLPFEHLENGITFALRDASSFEYDNWSTPSGILEREKTFSKIGNQLFKTKEVSYIYDYGKSKELNNLVIYKIFPDDYVNLRCGETFVRPISVFYLGIYKTYAFNQKLQSIVTRDYIQPVPLSIYPTRTDIDEELIAFEDPLENPYKKITTKQDFEYGTFNGLPTKVTMTTSESSKVKIIKNIYANQGSTLSVSGPQLAAYQKLEGQNKIATPIQVEQYENTELLSKTRTLYKEWNSNPEFILPETIQTAKAAQILEDRVVISEYDPKGNPSIISYKDGTKTKYFYNNDNQAIIKIDNYIDAMGVFSVKITNPCDFINSYTKSFVTLYYYNTITKLLETIINPNCEFSYYEYDDFHRLRFIKDDKENILKEFDNNYRIQN